MGGGGSRHIPTGDVNEVSKDITPTAPPMIAYNLGITFYIGDGQDGTQFTSDHMTLKGVGVTETKAYISALKRISTSNAAIKSFVEEGKRRILEYYERKCEYTLREAETYVQQNDFSSAIAALMNVPKESKTYYESCMARVGEVYQKKIDYECQPFLRKAQTAWAVGKAKEASSYLSEIDVNSECYQGVLNLEKEIKETLEKKEKQKLALEVKERERKHELEKARLAMEPEARERRHELQKQTIEAARQVALKHIENQPKRSYTLAGLGWR